MTLHQQFYDTIRCFIRQKLPDLYKLWLDDTRWYDHAGDMHEAWFSVDSVTKEKNEDANQQAKLWKDMPHFLERTLPLDADYFPYIISLSEQLTKLDVGFKVIYECHQQLIAHASAMQLHAYANQLKIQLNNAYALRVFMLLKGFILDKIALQHLHQHVGTSDSQLLAHMKKMWRSYMALCCDGYPASQSSVDEEAALALSVLWSYRSNSLKQPDQFYLQLAEVKQSKLPQSSDASDACSIIDPLKKAFALACTPLTFSKGGIRLNTHAIGFYTTLQLSRCAAEPAYVLRSSDCWINAAISSLILHLSGPLDESSDLSQPAYRGAAGAGHVSSAADSALATTSAVAAPARWYNPRRGVNDPGKNSQGGSANGSSYTQVAQAGLHQPRRGVKPRDNSQGGNGNGYPNAHRKTVKPWLRG